jgi:hypothetical protein
LRRWASSPDEDIFHTFDNIEELQILSIDLRIGTTDSTVTVRWKEKAIQRTFSKDKDGKHHVDNQKNDEK